MSLLLSARAAHGWDGYWRCFCFTGSSNTGVADACSPLACGHGLVLAARTVASGPGGCLRDRLPLCFRGICLPTGCWLVTKVSTGAEFAAAAWTGLRWL